MYNMNFAMGWREGLSIPQVFASFPELSTYLPRGLITCIDSSYDLASMPDVRDIVERQTVPCSFLGNGLVADTASIALLATAPLELFHGFDVVWLLSNIPFTLPPQEVPLTSEIPIDISLSIPMPALDRWIRQYRPVIGFGDGCGLNFIASDANLSEMVLKMVEMD